MLFLMPAQEKFHLALLKKKPAQFEQNSQNFPVSK